MATPLAAIGIDNGTVLVLVTLIVLPIAAIAFARSGAAWRELGKGPFAIDQAPPPQGASSASSAAEAADHEAEAREIIEAKSYLRERRDGQPLEVEAEVAALLERAGAGEDDDELHAEVRRLVVARNERRLRRGEEPLDVEVETERQLADFIGSG